MLNVVALMGRLTADPELRQTPQGTAVTTFTLAVERSYVKQGEQRQSDFIDIVAWRGTAEFVCRYFKKGSSMAVDGAIQTRTYTDKEGKNRKAFEIIANNIHFAGPKQSGDTGASYDRGTYSQPEPVAYAAGDVNDFAVIDDNEDLPF
ncbi:single-stranded DNA-binding protein [Ruminococcaceae bacterium OttesenSCG-928-N02]|nr:single-stranded DNA-binding protein [Ruminococcaceae bacterium OttesenSCG-928-N02]